MSKRKRRFRSGFKGPSAQPPEILTADPTAPAPSMQFIGYGKDDFQELHSTDINQITDLLSKFPVCWINVDGLGDAQIVEQIGKLFDLHHLAMEDVLHPVQRAKVELYPDQVFIVIRMLVHHSAPETEQLSIFLGKNYVLTFQERAGGDCLDALRERLRKSWGMIRHMGADFLMYAIIDTVVDAFFPVLEDYGEKLDLIEDRIFDKPSREIAKEVHALKRDILGIRRTIWPLRDAISSLYRDQLPLIAQETQYHLRDCHDHVMRIMDLVETAREYAQDLMDLYLSSVSNRMNEVMKTLTVLTTLIMAPTLVAGIYGMNFNPAVSPFNMPELNFFYGYPMAIGLMVASSLLALLYFKTKGWLGSDEITAAESNEQQPVIKAESS